MGFTRQVAVKLLKPEREDDEDLLGDLLREGAICAQLNHRNIVDVHSVEQHGGMLVVEMELITGGTVKQLIDRLGAAGLRVPRSAVLDIGLQVCAGLDHAWSGQGGDGEPLRVVHRDLKPANLLLTEHGEVRIADFGLAKRLGDPSQSAVGGVKGTPSYSAPETFRESGAPVLPAVDMFALGCVLFELWTGRVLHGTDTLPAVVTRIIMGDPAQEVAPLRREFPELAGIVEALLDRDPTRRLGMPEVGERLASLRAGLRGEPDLGTLIELARCLERGERSTRPGLLAQDPDWLTLYGRVQGEESSRTTVIEPLTVEEALFEAKPAPKAKPKPALKPRAKPKRDEPRGSGRLVGGLVAACLVLLVAIIVVVRLPRAPAAPTAGACLVLGSSPPGAQVWIDGSLTQPAGDHRGTPRWHAPGVLAVAMGGDGAEVVRTRVDAPGGSATRVVCSVGDRPACLVARAAPGACEGPP